MSAFTASWEGRTRSSRYSACSSQPGIPSSRRTDQALRAWEGVFRLESTHMWSSLCRGVRVVVQGWEAWKISLLSWQACRPIATAIVKLNSFKMKLHDPLNRDTWNSRNAFRQEVAVFVYTWSRMLRKWKLVATQALLFKYKKRNFPLLMDYCWVYLLGFYLFNFFFCLIFFWGKISYTSTSFPSFAY